MCGIAGFYGQCADRQGVLRAMMDAVTHRGPDDAGQYVDDYFALGFRRLSIIDVEGGAQPVFNEDRSLVLCLNGEIYNYRELRSELIELGHTFTTHSDSEVLVHAYEQYGPDMLPKLRGMFAFVVYDTTTGRMFAARDYFGIKPFQYYNAGADFVFGSEIKSLLLHPRVPRKLNLKALDNYLSFEYSVPEETFFDGVVCLRAGHYLVVDPQRDEKGGITGYRASVTRWFHPTFDIDPNLTKDVALDRIDEAITDSVSAHRIADVEVGCFLSGGVDSGLIASFFGGQRAFTVAFEHEGYDESDYARDLAKECNLKHECRMITAPEFWDSIAHIQYMMDQPMADPAAVPLYFVSELAAKDVKVVLSGEGSDELFGGYHIYKEPFAVDKLRRVPLPLRRLAAAAASKLPKFKGQSYLVRASRTIEQRYIGDVYVFSYEEKRRLLAQPIATDPQATVRPYYAGAAGLDDITKMQYIDINVWLEGDILAVADRMAMAHSLELRVPYLDKVVFGVSRTLPTAMRVTPDQTKVAMREVAKRHIPKVSAERTKLGFPVPLRVWMRQPEYYGRIKTAFTSESARQFFRTEELVDLLDRHYSGKWDNSRKIWTVYVFLVWYEAYFGADAAASRR